MNKDYEEGKTLGFSCGFTAGFWAAVLLVGAVVIAGLLVLG